MRPSRLGRAPTTLVAGAIMVAGAVVAAGCGGSGHHGATGPGPSTASPGSSTTSTTTPTSAATGYFTDAAIEVGFPSAPTNFNPLAAPGPSPALQAIAAAVLPSAFHLDVAGVPVPQPTLIAGATSVGVSPQRVTYTINPRAVWSDGTPITGADFVATWQAQAGRTRYRDVGGAAYTPASTVGYDRIASVVTDAQDPDRVTVTFARIDPDWRALFSPILPAHVVTSVGFDHGFTDPVTSLVSGGPFVVTAYTPGAEVRLARNPRWWGQAANLSGVDVELGVAPAVAAASLLHGSLGAALLPDDPATVTTLSTTDGLAAPVSAGDRYDDLAINERRSGLADRAVRLAIASGIDRRALAATAARTAATATPATVGRTAATATPVDDRVELAATAGRAPTTGATAAPDDATALPAATSSSATRLALVTAGLTYRDGRLRDGGRPVRFGLLVGSDSPLAAAEAAAVGAACRAAGIGLTTTFTTPATAERRVAAGRYDLAVVGTRVATFPVSLAARYATGGSDNVTGYSSPAMDRLVARVDTTPLGPARTAAVAAVDRLAWSDAVDVPLLADPVVLASQSRYVNVVAATGPAGIAAGISTWGIPQHT